MTQVERRAAEATEKFGAAQAHYMIESFIDLPAMIVDIERRLAQAAEVPAS